MNNEPLATIIIMTYNRCELLKAAIECSINQTCKDIEILIGDNCSSDETQSLCEEYAAKDSRIKYFRHDKNIGMHNNVNFLINKVKTKYCAILCDDDTISTNYIEELCELLEQNEDCIIASGTNLLYGDNNELIKHCETVNLTQDDYTQRMLLYIHKGISEFVSNCLYRTKMLKIDKECHKSRFCEDQITIMKYLLLGKCISSPNVFYHKLNNGCTKDLKTLKKTYNMPHMTQYNFWKYLSRCHCNAILNDDFYIKHLSLKERRLLAGKIAKEIEAAFKSPSNLKNILQYMWRHPLFILRKDFYMLLKKEFSL